MQGHFEGSQPSPYASISVNNPSRFTNSNLVNRRYCAENPQQSNQVSPMAIKPVIPRRRTINNAGTSSQLNQMIHDQIIPTSSAINHSNINQDTTSDGISMRSSSPHHSSASTPIPNMSQVDIKPNIQNLNIPYNGTLHPTMGNMPNMEIATLFTMSFNQNFNQSNNN